MWMMARVIGCVVATLVTASGVRAQTLAPACPLLSQAAAAGINGAAVSAGQEVDVPGTANVCTYSGTGNDGSVGVAESVDTPGGMSFKTLEMNPPAAATTMKLLSGIGDGAYLTKTGPNFDVWVLKGHIVLDITAMPAKGGDPDVEAAMVAAAKAALAKM
jgi:hypothetical protein